MPNKSKEIVIHELQQQVDAHEAVVKAWETCPYPELLFDEACRSNQLSHHFTNAITAIRRYA